MFANVGREGPRREVRIVAADAGFGRLFDELYVTPGGVSDGAGVVVTEAAPVETIGIDLIPLLARDFAGFAADTERGVG
jgi:hypothetical protein